MIESIGGLTRNDLMCYVETLNHFGDRISGILTHFEDSPWNQGPWSVIGDPYYNYEYQSGRQMYITLMTNKLKTHQVHSGTKVVITVVGRGRED